MGLATLPKKPVSRSTPGPNPITSMSQGIHQGIFSFADGFDRPETQDQQHHIAQQSRRDKLRVPQGFDPAPPQSLVPIEDEGVGPSMYEPVGGGNMLSDMFNFPTPGGANSDLLGTQIPQANYRFPARPSANYSGGGWYGDPKNHQHGDLMTGMHSESAMQLFLTNPPAIPPHPRSPSPPPPHHNHGFHAFGDTSLSLSSSLQQFEMAKAEDGVLYFNNQHHHHHLQQQQQQQNPSLQMQGQQSQQGQQGQQVQNMGYGPMGVVNVLRNSKYARAAQELLEEFCSVGRGQLKGSRIGRHHGSSSNPNPNSSSGAGSAVAGSSSNSKEIPALSPAERFEHQRKKAKLLSMLDEVDRRYNHYCDQMQMVVNSFDSVMGFGAALPYTALAQKAMSRHFRCLKDSVATQLKQTCELLGEKEGGTGSGITKGETPRLRLLDQSLRQQRAFHQMGMMEQEAWRPQRGLPERSVTILRAWLFEHFLHPYPSDADKHLLARQTGLSRNQVSNWFINARVRLWKPMVEEMYQQESKDEPGDRQWEPSASHQSESQSPKQPQQQQQQRPEIKKPESDPHHHHRFPSNPAVGEGPAPDDVYRAGPSMVGSAGRARATGDVSLTLGLRHAGNAPDKGRFTIRDFGDC